MEQNFDHRRRELERQIAEQADHLRRMVVCGAPNQAAEDRLSRLEQQLVQVKAGR